MNGDPMTTDVNGHAHVRSGNSSVTCAAGEAGIRGQVALRIEDGLGPSLPGRRLDLLGEVTTLKR
jgi:hypothetical protein